MKMHYTGKPVHSEYKMGYFDAFFSCFKLQPCLWKYRLFLRFILLWTEVWKNVFPTIGFNVNCFSVNRRVIKTMFAFAYHIIKGKRNPHVYRAGYSPSTELHCIITNVSLRNMFILCNNNCNSTGYGTKAAIPP